MPMTWVEPEVFLEHMGVTIYHTYRHDMETDRSDYIFTTDSSDSDRDSDSQFHFDVRDIAHELVKVWVGASGHFPADNKNILMGAIEYGMIPVPDDCVVAQLAAQIENREDLLDELVHDVASKAGSAANNAGPVGQIEFLIEELGQGDAKKAILEVLDRSKGVK